LLAASLMTKAEPKGDLLTWAIIQRRLLKPGVLFDLTRHRYLRDLYQEAAQDVVVYKAAQMGASEYGVTYALHAADVRAATVLYVFPTDTHVSDFSAARIGPAIEASPYLSSVVVDGGGSQEQGHKRGADRVTLKRVRDSFLYFRGARVKKDGQAPQLKSIDADVLILDEVDEMDPRAPSIAAKRLGHSTIAESRWIGTPTFEGVGIHAQWLESDQREWHVRCEGCGRWQPLTIDHVVTEWDKLGRPMGWHRDEEGAAFMACEHCGEALDRTGDGRWVPTWRERRQAGFHLTKLFSPFVSLDDIVTSLQNVDETKRREAFNQDLGLPYTPRGGRLTSAILDACRREYGHGPVRGEQTLLGCDVGKMLHVVIRGPQDPESGERPQRWSGALDSFEALGRMMRKYQVATAVIDALPETRKARELQNAFSPRRVWLAYYVQQRVGSKHAEPAVWDPRKGVVNLDRTRTLDSTFAQFYEPVEATLPADARDIRDYYDHLKAPVRVMEEMRDGSKVARYVEGGQADHLAHAENYCWVAAKRPVVRKRARSFQG
jgi:hypothetical protein